MKDNSMTTAEFEPTTEAVEAEPPSKGRKRTGATDFLGRPVEDGADYLGRAIEDGQDYLGRSIG